MQPTKKNSDYENFMGLTGKSTLDRALNRELHSRRHLTYVLDGDNLRHGLNRDLSIEAEDHAENKHIVAEIESTQLQGLTLKGPTDSGLLVVRVVTSQASESHRSHF
ncbi:hypothetical protein EJB05_33899, partial [Eragrostis curvula]